MNAAILMAAAATLVQPPATVRAHVDDIVVGVASLEAGIAAFERLTGVTAVRGGQHPARGTENALVSLGAGRYLELIAARPGVSLDPELERLRSLEKPAIIAWAVNVSDMDAARRAMAGAGVTLAAEAPGSRVTPSGATLEWATANIASPQLPYAPFLIHWRPSTPHPSTTSPGGCSLAALTIQDRSPDLSRALNALRLSGVTVRQGEPQIAADLKCPRGHVTITN